MNLITILLFGIFIIQICRFILAISQHITVGKLNARFELMQHESDANENAFKKIMREELLAMESMAEGSRLLSELISEAKK